MWCQLFSVSKADTLTDSFHMARPISQNKRVFISAKVLPELIEALEKLADLEERSRSQVLERVAIAWFREHRPDLLREPE